MTPELQGVFEEQARRFREKFGREMGPDDPVFFDPDADEPMPIPEKKLADIYALMAEHGFDEEWMEKRRRRLEEEGAVRKVGRNDPCPCGSGLKYKRCCGR